MADAAVTSGDGRAPGRNMGGPPWYTLDITVAAILLIFLSLLLPGPITCYVCGLTNSETLLGVRLMALMLSATPAFVGLVCLIIRMFTVWPKRVRGTRA